MKKKLVFVTLFIILIGTLVGVYYIKEKDRKAKLLEQEKQTEVKKKKDLIKEIKEKYNTYVKTNKTAGLYILENKQYKKVGTVKKEISYILEDIGTITEETKYFKIKDFPFYISYKDVEKVETYTEPSQDYKNYIPFGESIVTKNTKLYQGDTLVYDLKDSITAPVLVKDNTYRYIAYNNDLFYVKEEDIKETIPSESKEVPTTKMAVLNYHFFFEDGDKACNEIMCIPRSQFEKELEYLQKNEYYAVSMKEFKWFLDKKVQFSKKTVLITADDGAYGTENVLPSALAKYKMKGSLFLITSTRKPEKYKFPYLELHSHSNDMHNTGICPGGQGGGIKCLKEEDVLADLKTSRDLLNQTTAFAYPFYEYNTRAITLLKKAGFTMAFIGGNKKASIGVDKMLIPRYAIVNSTTLNDFIKKVS
ncbi:MAG: polysaccharide deacetylase family protein [Bacilli bacterium]|nr:polysaccharide deacetylase family protein [Bacilli bacterium]